MEHSDVPQLEVVVHKQLQACSPVFLALADPVRQDIIMMLTRHEALNVAQIVERTPMSRSAISHHLRILKQADLLTAVKTGTEIYYSLDIEDAVRLLKEFLETTEQILASKMLGDE